MGNVSRTPNPITPAPLFKNRLSWVFALTSAVYFTQGIEALPSQALFYYFKETICLSPQRIMFLSGIVAGAWLVKPLIGYLIDNALNKRVWIFLSLLASIIFALALGTAAYLPIAALVALLLLSSASAALRDVSVDGIMCVEGKKYQATGRIQSVQWIAISLAGLAAGVGGGFLAQRFSYQAAFLLIIPVYLAAGLAARIYKEQGCLPAAKRSFTTEMRQLFADKKLLTAAAFIFLYRYSPSFGAPLLFVQRDGFHWSKEWIGLMSGLGTAFEICGAVLYYKFSTRIRIRKWLFFSVFLGAMVSLSYLYYTPLTAIIYNVAYGLLGMFIFLALMDFMARSSTPGLEATSFAFLCSVSNLALVASNLSGAWLLPLVGLQWLIVLSALASFLCLPLIKRIPG
jgi:MFS family permease